ncbi:MAG: SusE domain-containing protein [Chitinophagaceae bacterium]|nr:SusE domain-containing protein [Chitinophagaceae bacterium]
MKKLLGSASLIISAGLLLLSSCEKAKDLPFYPEGKAVTLTASSNAIAPATTDSNNVALTLKWTNPAYPLDTSTTKYIVQIDAAGNGFKDPLTRTVTGKTDTSFIAKELNAYAVAHLWTFNKAQSVEARVISSYPNNNDQVVSNVVAFTYTPYLVPPKVTPPASRELFLVGDATAGGWDNPVPVSQKFTMIDSVTYQGTFFMNGGKQYLLLPVNGNWDHKYSVADGNLPGLSGGGDFGADLSSNIPGPATTGMYTIFVDFQHGIFKVTNVSQYGLLWVPGDYQEWAPATAPQIGSPNNDGSYDGYVNVPTGGTYLFKFTLQPDWSNALGDGGGGTLSPSGGNLLFPGAGGYFHLKANTQNNTYSITPTNTWGVIGSFAGSGWGTDVPMTYNSGSKRWEATITTVAGDQFKFRANGGWDLNYGDNDGTGKLVEGGANIGDDTKNFAVPAGTHKIYLYLENPGYYTYTVL